MIPRSAPLWLGLLALSCARTEVFECNEDSACIDGGRMGSCEPNGFCSFPDPACASGRRYGDHAGDGLANDCVDPGVADAAGSDDTPSTSVEPSASLSQGDDDGASGFTTVPDPDAVCGNGDAESSELCDGADLGGSSCAALGHDSGTLACNDDCTFDTSGCGDCGNAIVDGDELCDGEGLPDESCTSVGWFGGQLTCAAGCDAIDDSACTNCGNQVVDPGEWCDGNLPETSCAGLGFSDQDGVPTCAADCTLDVSDCGMPVCGMDAAVPLFDCPPECTSCEHGECLIDCDGTATCADLPIACPPGWPCRVSCVGTSACNGASIACPEYYPCNVACESTSACNELTLACSLTGICAIDCADDSAAVCDDAVVECGADGCAAVCAGGDPNVECGPSCACTACGN